MKAAAVSSFVSSHLHVPSIVVYRAQLKKFMQHIITELQVIVPLYFEQNGK